MARFSAEIPNDVIKQLEKIERNSEVIFGCMCKVGALVAFKRVKGNMKNAFKTTRSLEKGLRISKTYNTPSDDGINVFVGFTGYDDESISPKYPRGKPIPLIALAREYGTSRGETKKPFFRKSFKKKEIEAAMLKEQRKYIPE